MEAMAEDGDDFNPEDEIEEIEDFDEANLENDIEEIEEEEEDVEVDEDDVIDVTPTKQKPDVETSNAEKKPNKEQPKQPPKTPAKSDKGSTPKKDKVIRVKEHHSSGSDEEEEELSSGPERMDEDEEEEEEPDGLIDFEYNKLPLEQIAKARGMTVINMSRKKNTKEDEDVFVDVCKIDDPPVDKDADKAKTLDGAKKTKDALETILIDNDEGEQKEKAKLKKVELPKVVKGGPQVIKIIGNNPVIIQATTNPSGVKDTKPFSYTVTPGKKPLYKIDVSTMAEEKAKVLKERERRTELLFYYKALQGRVSQVREMAGLKLWPKQIILQKANNTIIQLKKSDTKLGVQFEDEMQKNFILKKKLRDQKLMDAFKRYQADGLSNTTKPAATSTPQIPPHVKKPIFRPSRTIIVKKIMPDMVTKIVADKEKEVTATKESESKPETTAEEQQQQQTTPPKNEVKNRVIVKVKKLETLKESGKEIVTEKEVPRTIITAIKPAGIEDLAIMPRDGLITTQKLVPLNWNTRELDLIAAIKNLKKSNKFIVTIPSKKQAAGGTGQQQETTTSALPIVVLENKKTPLPGNTAKAEEVVKKLKEDEVVLITDDEDETKNEPQKKESPKEPLKPTRVMISVLAKPKLTQPSPSKTE